MKTPEENTPDTSKSRKFPLGDQLLRDQLSDLIKEKGWTRERAGLKLGVGAAYVAKYINGSNDFDPSKMNRSVADLLKAERMKSGEAVRIFPTFVTDRIRGAFETIRKTNDFGLVFSAAGLGKSSAMQLFLDEFPLAIGITASKGVTEKRELESHIFAQVETRAYDNRTSRWDFLVRHLRDSDRPILIDNSQRLRIPALQWLFDFQDETAVPICLLGNPEVLTTIRRNDQMFSRIGLKDEIVLPERRKANATQRTQVDAVVDGILQQMVPDWAADLRELSLQVAWERGHFRALRKTLTFALQLSLVGGPLKEPKTAFRAAHEKLVRNYSLEDAE
jgi:DNA transposition AAA+ family ATPase